MPFDGVVLTLEDLRLVSVSALWFGTFRVLAVIELRAYLLAP